MNCKFCGNEIQENDMFCGKCGGIVSEGSSICPYCGEENKDNDLYCGKCGKKIKTLKQGRVEPIKENTAITFINNKISIQSLENVFSILLV